MNGERPLVGVRANPEREKPLPDQFRQLAAQHLDRSVGAMDEGPVDALIGQKKPPGLPRHDAMPARGVAAGDRQISIGVTADHDTIRAGRKADFTPLAHQPQFRLG